MQGDSGQRFALAQKPAGKLRGDVLRIGRGTAISCKEQFPTGSQRRANHLRRFGDIRCQVWKRSGHFDVLVPNGFNLVFVLAGHCGARAPCFNFSEYRLLSGRVREPPRQLLAYTLPYPTA